MELNFQAAIDDARIGGQAGIVRLANAARPNADYLLTTLLPERNLPTYQASDGSMTVRTTMAGAVGMDSKYPEGGAAEMSTFREEIAKVAIQNNLSEKTLRDIQALADQVLLRGGNTTQLAVDTVLNFVSKMLLQAHFDRAEWLRGKALFTGAINWRFNGSNVVVDYGVPAANKFPTRTGTDAYGGTTSVFWKDVQAARRILGNSYSISIGSRATIESVVYNSANAINVLDISGGRYTIQRFRGSLERPSTDARETMTLVEYDLEGEVINPLVSGETIKVPMIPAGVIGHFGRADASREFIPGQGATDNPSNALELGYTHVGPTTEGGGTPGRWARVYTPEGMPMQLRGQAVSNVLPVITKPRAIVLTSTVLV